MPVVVRSQLYEGTGNAPAVMVMVAMVFVVMVAGKVNDALRKIKEGTTK